MTFKVVLFGSIVIVAYYIGTYRIRQANRYFQHIKRTHNEADRLRKIHKGLIEPSRHDQFVQFMNVWELEDHIFKMYCQAGLEDMGNTQYWRVINALKFSRIEEVDDTTAPPLLGESVKYYADNQAKKPPTPLRVGDRRKNTIPLEIIG